MNEEELNKIIGSKLKYVREKGQAFSEIDLDSVEDCIEDGFQKGKLEQKKEELEFLLIMKEHIETNNCPLPTLRLNDRIEQLQKEIGDNSQQPRMKQTRGGELKSDEGLHSTDNGSPADIVSKEDSEDICICGHHTKDHSYDPNKLDADLECDICDCKRFKTKEDRSFLGGYAEFWDNPEDNRWDKEEEKQDDTK